MSNTAAGNVRADLARVRTQIEHLQRKENALKVELEALEGDTPEYLEIEVDVRTDDAGNEAVTTDKDGNEV